MNRTHIASAANPNSAAPSPATANMVSGAVKRVPTRAPTHKPAYEAPHASSGVTSQPRTMRRCANQRGTAPPAPRPPSLPLAGECDDGERRQRDSEAGAGLGRKDEPEVEPGDPRHGHQNDRADQHRRHGA